MTELQKLHRDRRDADIISGAVLIITALDDYEAVYHHSASLLIPSSRVHSCALVCKRFAHMFLLIYQAFYPKNSTCAVCALFF